MLKLGKHAHVSSIKFPASSFRICGNIQGTRSIPLSDTGFPLRGRKAPPTSLRVMSRCLSVIGVPAQCGHLEVEENPIKLYINLMVLTILVQPTWIFFFGPYPLLSTRRNKLLFDAAAVQGHLEPDRHCWQRVD